MEMDCANREKAEIGLTRIAPLEGEYTGGIGVRHPRSSGRNVGCGGQDTRPAYRLFLSGKARYFRPPGRASAA